MVSGFRGSLHHLRWSKNRAFRPVFRRVVLVRGTMRKTEWTLSSELSGTPRSLIWKISRHSMYVIFAYIGVVLGVNVGGIYGIHGVSGYGKTFPFLVHCKAASSSRKVGCWKLGTWKISA